MQVVSEDDGYDLMLSPTSVSGLLSFCPENLSYGCEINNMNKNEIAKSSQENKIILDAAKKMGWLNQCIRNPEKGERGLQSWVGRLLPFAYFAFLKMKVKRRAYLHIQLLEHSLLRSWDMW